MSADDDYQLIEEDFNGFLGESLSPRGPELMYELVPELPPDRPASILDLGCGKGRHSIELAKRFAAIVRGVDPDSDSLAEARRALAEACRSDRGLRDLVHLSAGSAEHIPLEDNSVDVVWCRDVLCLVENLERAYAECRRVLRDGGRVIIYQMFATDRLEPREAAEIYGPLGCVASSMVPERTELVVESAGFRVEDCIVLGTEWGEFFEEASGKAGRLLLHAGRLIRDPDRYVGSYNRNLWMRHLNGGATYLPV
jgi:SAM-dependent methyltransferase